MVHIRWAYLLVVLVVLCHALYACCSHLLHHLSVHYEMRRDCDNMRGSINPHFIEQCLRLREHHPLIHTLHGAPEALAPLLTQSVASSTVICIMALLYKIPLLQRLWRLKKAEQVRRAENELLAKYKNRQGALDEKKTAALIALLEPREQ